MFGPRSLIIVAKHRSDRCEDGERIENVRATDIAGMNDMVAAAQERERIGAQQSVRIGDETYANHRVALALAETRNEGAGK